MPCLRCLHATVAEMSSFQLSLEAGKTYNLAFCRKSALTPGLEQRLFFNEIKENRKFQSIAFEKDNWYFRKYLLWQNVCLLGICARAVHNDWIPCCESHRPRKMFNASASKRAPASAVCSRPEQVCGTIKSGSYMRRKDAQKGKRLINTFRHSTLSTQSISLKVLSQWERDGICQKISISDLQNVTSST